RDTVTVPSASQYNAVAGAPTSMIVEPAGYARAVITPISARAPGFDSADSSGAGGTCFGWRAISHFPSSSITARAWASGSPGGQSIAGGSSGDGGVVNVKCGPPVA